MKTYFRFFTLVIFSCIQLISFAQAGSISGVVKDKNNSNPLESAKVMLMGVNKMAIVDAAGAFSFPSVEQGTYVMEVRFMGYLSQKVENITVKAGQNTVVNFDMDNATKNEKDVKVIFQTKPKGDAEITKMQLNQGGLVDGINKSTRCTCVGCI